MGHELTDSPPKPSPSSVVVVVVVVEVIVVFFFIIMVVVMVAVEIVVVFFIVIMVVVMVVVRAEEEVRLLELADHPPISFNAWSAWSTWPIEHLSMVVVVAMAAALCEAAVPKPGGGGTDCSKVPPAKCNIIASCAIDPRVKRCVPCSVAKPLAKGKCPGKCTYIPGRLGGMGKCAIAGTKPPSPGKPPGGKPPAPKPGKIKGKLF